jgi:hypothetical protein
MMEKVTGGTKVVQKAVRQSDAELVAIMEEPRVWAIHGNTKIQGVAATLRRAIEKADVMGQSGTPVVAISRPPPHRLFIFHDQIVRLAEIVRQREVH